MMTARAMLAQAIAVFLISELVLDQVKCKKSPANIPKCLLDMLCLLSIVGDIKIKSPPKRTDRRIDKVSD